ncbi:MAG TPA: DUF3775 domain-containing protein [Beijerinckiaceae bacterium]|nr:DUF3775 domain-containing protein [Methylobacteriaceae bacterium]HPG03443.1 DUF3775 domain-containing protein [Rhodoblastus sp.]HRY01912.1 DUF3775 domain-containing protein [Beijerinckiaceae bacterium]
MKRENEPDMPEIAVEKVCFVATMGRQIEAHEEVRPDASNPADDGEAVALTSAADQPARRELTQYLDALDVDESDALVALAWIGRGDFEATDWKTAVAEAGRRRETKTSAYLLGMPLLPDYLEDALSAFDRSCEDFELKE